MTAVKGTDVHLQKCPHHDTENQTFYCANHDVTICGRCYHSHHKQCDPIDLFTVTVDELRQRETLTILSAFEKEIEGYEMALKKDIQFNDQCKANVMHDVDSFCSKMMARLLDLKKDAERECTKKHKQNSDRLSKLVKKYNEEKLLVSQRKQLVEVLIQKKHSRHLYIERFRLDRNKNEISTMINSLIKKEKAAHFSFRPNDKLANVICSQISDIGKIQETINESDEVIEDGMQNDTIEGALERFGLREKPENPYDQNGRGSRTTMLCTLYGNVIVMLEEYEARTDKIELPRSEIDTPDQSWKTVEDVMDNVESQLVLFEAHIDACPFDVTSRVHKDLRIKAIYWTAVRAEQRLPLTGTDTFIARLYEILAKRSRTTQTSMAYTSQKLWRQRHDASGIRSSCRETQTQNSASLRTRTPINMSDVCLGAKRIQYVNPSLAACLKEDVEEESLQLASLP